MSTIKSTVLLAVVAGLSSSCASLQLGGPPTPNPDQEKPLVAEHYNPYPPGTYEHFTTEPSYPKTYKIFRNHALLNSMDPRDARVQIDLGLQRAILYHGEEVAMDYPVSSGKKKFPTPPGSYAIVEKIKAEKRSNLYGTIYSPGGDVHKRGANLNEDEIPEGGTFKGASMPYWMRLTWDGIGMHQGRVPRYPASHGCIRLPSSVASTLFSKTKVGTPVSVVP